MTERVYYENKRTGDLAYLVERDGKQVLRLDRANIEMLRPITKDWVLQETHRPITRGQLGMVAFEADKALCKALGLHDEARRDWLRMSTQARIDFTEHGPKDNRLRKDLWKNILETLKDAAE